MTAYGGELPGKNQAYSRDETTITYLQVEELPKSVQRRLVHVRKEGTTAGKTTTEKIKKIKENQL